MYFQRPLLFLAILSLCGCNSFRWGWLKKDQDSGKPAGQVPNTAAIVSYLNENASRMQSLRVDDLSVTAGRGLQNLVSVTGILMAEKPRNFRLGVKALSNPVVDLGSNNQEFWFWVKDSSQYYCSYKDLEEGRVQTMPIPIQPEWVMETLGLGPYGPADKYQQESDGRSIRLIERTKTPTGKAVRKVMVFRWPAVKPPQAQVTDFLLIEEGTNKELCAAHIGETQVDRATGAILPRLVEFRCLDPEQKVMKLTMCLNGASVNPNPALPKEAFLRQPMRGIESFDLARLPTDNRVQRTQGFQNP